MKYLNCQRKKGFSLVEVMIAVGIVSLGALSTLSLLIFSRMHNDLEMERSRAHQIVSQELELIQFSLYPRIRTDTQTTIWNNGTPTDAADDTTGLMTVTARNPYTGATVTVAPVPAVVLQVEVTLSWNPRGSLGNKTYRETAMTYVSP